MGDCMSNSKVPSLSFPNDVTMLEDTCVSFMLFCQLQRYLSTIFIKFSRLGRQEQPVIGWTRPQDELSEDSYSLIVAVVYRGAHGVIS